VSRARLVLSLVGLAGAGTLLSACAGPSGPTPVPTPFAPGASSTPRNVIVQMYDYRYLPAVVDLVPGETVNFQVIDGGLEIHEAILGDMPTQLLWESAEAATVGHPPGPTPFVSPPLGFEGTRIVAASGQRVDVVWTVPADAASASSGWFLGCHIPGHWAKGMVVPVRFVDSSGQPIASTPVLPSILPTPAGS
jgi:plastocyanin